MSNITFVGAGMIGAGLAINAVMHGERVTVMDQRNYEDIEPSFLGIFDIFVENGVCTKTEAEAYMKQIYFTKDLTNAVIGADFIQESIVEKIEAKKELYANIQKICGDKQPIIASSTSLLFPSALSEGARYPEMILVGHPYNPSYLMQIMEICGGENASEDVIQTTKRIYETWGKVPVICRKEVKGFIANEINQTVTRLCRDQVVNGICTAEDMDKAIMYGPGIRMAILGQLMTTSLGIEGGFKNMCKKYNLPENPDYDLLAEQMEDVFAKRKEEEGNTPETVIKYRDKMLIEIMKIKNLM